MDKKNSTSGRDKLKEVSRASFFALVSEPWVRYIYPQPNPVIDSLCHLNNCDITALSSAFNLTLSQRFTDPVGCVKLMTGKSRKVIEKTYSSDVTCLSVCI